MTYSCKRVLKELRKLADGTEKELAFMFYTDLIVAVEDISQTWSYGKLSGEIHSIIGQLEKNGYIIYTQDQYHFRLTHLGLHPCRYMYERARNFVIKSAAVPVLVAIITAIATMVLNAVVSRYFP